MEMLRSVNRVVNWGEWLYTVDLKDAYMHIPIRAEHRKYLRFRKAGNFFNGKWLHLECRQPQECLQKVLAPVIAEARKRGVHTFLYLNNVLVQNGDQGNERNQCKYFYSFVERTWMTDTYVKLIYRTVTRPDLCRRPVSHNTKPGDVTTREVFNKEVHQSVCDQKPDSREFLRLLGIMATCIEVVFLARLRMRLIQMYLMCFWMPSSW